MTQENTEISILTIGDELLIGQVIDTNSAWMARELNASGFYVKRRVAVGDNRDEIWKALDEESAHARIILITGGLGPTADDITKPLLASYFGTRLVINKDVLAHVEHLFKNVFGRPMIERNKKQAEVPESCTVIHNSRGTAPGMWFEKNGRIYASMPGVPHEMQGIMKDSIIPTLLERFTTGAILHRTLLTAGIGESFLAERIEAWETALPPELKLAYLPNLGMVRLRITGRGKDERELDELLTTQFEALKNLVAEWLVTDQDDTLPKLVSRLLRNSSKTLATAESCTGGFIAHLLTKEPGASDFFIGSIVSYANQVKKELLSVKEETLSQFGAVSEETVIQMTKGALVALGTDYALATSGIMGPDGGSPDKPVGTVWIAAGNRERIITHTFSFRHDRLLNIELTANHALNLLRKLILGIAR